MSIKSNAFTFVVISVMVFLLSLLRPDLSQAATNGDWEGLTDQDLAISFTVAGDQATNIATRLRVYCSGFSAVVMTNHGTRDIINNSFSISGTTSACTPIPPFTYRPYGFTGTFTDENTCAGTYYYSTTQTGTWQASPACSMPQIDSFSSSAQTIAPGETVTLNWAISHADSAAIDQGVGSVDAASGSTDVTPSQTTTYTLTATNVCGTATESVTIEVNSQAGQCPGSTEKEFYPENAYAHDMQVSGNYLFLAVDHDHYWENNVLHLRPALQLWNLADPDTPQLVDTLSAGAAGQDANGWAVSVSGSRAYVGFGGNAVSGGVLIVDIETPQAPQFESVYNVPVGHGIRALAIQNQIIYAIRYDDINGYSLQVLDASDPTNVSEKDQIEIPVVEPQGIAVSGNYVYMATSAWIGSGGNGGIWIVDISDLDELSVISKYALPGSANGENLRAISLELAGNYAYLGYSGGSVVPPDDEHWDHAGLQIFNVTDPTAPIDAGHAEIGADAQVTDLFIHNGIVYMAAERNGGSPDMRGLVAIDASNPGAPTVIGHTPISVPGIRRCAVIGNKAIGLSGNDVSSPLWIFNIDQCKALGARISPAIMDILLLD